MWSLQGLLAVNKTTFDPKPLWLGRQLGETFKQEPLVKDRQQLLVCWR